MSLSAAIVLFNRDLRVNDHPALAAAVGEAERVVPLFVLDDSLLGSRFTAPNRLTFLLESLSDLDGSLRQRGARLVVRRGDPVQEALSVAREIDAQALFTSADVSAYAQGRERRLAEGCRQARIAFRKFPGATAVTPGELLPAGGDHFKVFTPYWRQWQVAPRRPAASAPRTIRLPARLAIGRLPRPQELRGAPTSPSLARGGETEGRRRVTAWLRGGLSDYATVHDDLAGQTSRLSPYLRFGCLSPLDLTRRVGGRPGGEAFVRQLCWRDFFAQVTNARPDIAHTDYRPRGDHWNGDDWTLAAWRAGRTGYPIVDAGIRQLEHEGYMHNRARLIVGSFLTKDLYLDWRAGARHFWDLLLDGDIPNNAMNWQWVAGTGNDSRPNRVLNPIAQAKRYDPAGEYVRRWLPELESLPGGSVHEPWRLPAGERRALNYPEPILDHAVAAARFRARRVAKRDRARLSS